MAKRVVVEEELLLKDDENIFTGEASDESELVVADDYLSPYQTTASSQVDGDDVETKARHVVSRSSVGFECGHPHRYVSPSLSELSVEKESEKQLLRFVGQPQTDDKAEILIAPTTIPLVIRTWPSAKEDNVAKENKRLKQKLHEKDDTLQLSHQKIQKYEQELEITDKQLKEQSNKLSLSQMYLREKNKELQLVYQQLEENEEKVLVQENEIKSLLDEKKELSKKHKKEEDELDQLLVEKIAEHDRAKLELKEMKKELEEERRQKTYYQYQFINNKSESNELSIDSNTSNSHCLKTPEQSEDSKTQLYKANETIFKQKQMIDDMTLQLTSKGDQEKKSSTDELTDNETCTDVITKQEDTITGDIEKLKAEVADKEILIAKLMKKQSTQSQDKSLNSVDVKVGNVTTHLDYLISSLSSLSDAHFKKSFLVQGDAPQLINWEQYGLKIHVSKGTLSSSDTAEVAVVALVGGQFVFPDNTKLVSGVYAVSVSKPLLQPLRLEIQHCVNLTREDQVKCLKFAIAHINTDSLPYQFSPEEGGQFALGSWYGLIEREEFSLVSIVGEVSDPVPEGDSEEDSEGEGSCQLSSEEEEEKFDGDSTSSSDSEKQKSKSRQQTQEGTEGVGQNDSGNPSISDHENENHPLQQQETRDSPIPPMPSLCTEPSYPMTMVTGQSTGTVEGMTYTGLIYYEEKRVEDLVTFTAAKHLKILCEYIEKKHCTAEIGQSVYFQFKPRHYYIELKLDAPQKDPFTGWTIKPHIEPLRLYQDDIDKFGDVEYFDPPACLVSVCGSPNAEPTLHYGVPVEGVVRPVTIFIHRSLRTISSSSDQVIAHSSSIVTKANSKISLDSKATDIACKVLKDNNSNIRNQIDLKYLVDKMSEGGLLSVQEKRRITDTECRDTEDKRKDELLYILQQTVEVDETTFKWFIQVLRDYGAKRMTILANKLDQEYQAKLL